MMRRSELRRARVAAVLVVAMMLTVTGLLGAPGAVVKLTSPKAGARVSGEIELAAAVKASAKVSYVVFGVDGDRPYSTNSSPYRFRLDTAMLPDGAHRVFAEAYDDFGLIGSSKAITIVVKNSSGVVIAKKAAAARAQAGAKAAVPPATNVAAHPAAFPGPRTVASAEEATARSLASPTALGGAPAPEPSRVADARASAPAQAREPAAGGYPGSAAGVVSTLPAAETLRGHTIVLNGEVVAFDVSPVVKDGRLQAGFRALFTQTRARVSWVAGKRTALCVSQSLTVAVPVGSRVASVNGAAVDMGATAVIREGRTMIPVRFFAAATGSALSWDSRTRVAALEAGRREVARSGSSG